MLETLLAVGISLAVLAVLVPLGLCYLLARQVAPIRPLRTLLIVLGLTIVGGPVGLAIGLLVAAALQRRWRRDAMFTAASSAVPAGLGRQWSSLLADAAAARRRFHRVVEDLGPGPLRDSLRAAADEVDDAMAEASRLAAAGDRTDRAHRDVLSALDSQRRRRRRSGGLSADLEHTLQAATRAQHESAERLAQAARRDMTQLQLLVARLHELTAHALELTTATSTAAAELPAATSIADRLAALRLATAEVDEAARV